MSLILKLQADLKTAWDLVQGETNTMKKEEALRMYKKKLAAYLKQRLFISAIEGAES